MTVMTGDRRTVLVGLILPATSVALGVSARLVDAIFPRWVGNMAAIWFLAGFLAGRWSARSISGGWAGLACLVTATGAYYTWRLVVDSTISIGYLGTVGVVWLSIALIVGSFSGWLGASSLESPKWWGAPAGVLVGEAVAVLTLAQRGTQVVAEIGLAVALVIGSRSPLRATAAPLLYMALVTTACALTYRIALS